MTYVIPDPRFEMPELFEPGRKPVGPVVIDWSHPLAKKLETFLYFRDGNVVDLVSGRVATKVNNPTSAVYKDHKGLGVKSSGSNSYYVLTGLPTKTINVYSTGMAVASCFDSIASQSDKRPFSFSDGSDFCQIECETSQHQGFMRADGDKVTTSGSGSNAVGSNYGVYQSDVNGTWGAAGRMSLFINGVHTQGATLLGTTQFNYNRCSIGALYRGTGEAFFNGIVPFATIWSRELTVNEINEYNLTKGGSVYSMLIPA